MKALAVVPAEKRIAVLDHPMPERLHPREALVRMIDIGVCGTDVDIASFRYGTPPDGSDYLIIGHESLGEVVDVGNDVDGLTPGDLVVTMVRRPCPHPHCRACRVERPDFCETLDYTERGINRRHGFMTEYIVDDAIYMNRVPSNLREIAVLVEPLTIAEKAIIEYRNVQRRLPWLTPGGPQPASTRQEIAVVLGAGPVGLLGAMAWKVAGLQVIVCSLESESSEKASIVKMIGGTYISVEGRKTDDIARQIGTIDVMFEATGAAQVAFDMMQLISANSTFVFTGIPGRRGSLNIAAGTLMQNIVLKNQLIFGTVNAGKPAFQHAIRDIETFHNRWPQAVGSLITGRYPVERAEDILRGGAPGIKRVIAMGAHKTSDRRSATREHISADNPKP